MNATVGWNWNSVSDSYWSVPSEDVYYYLHRWRNDGFVDLLDLGCGIGRHSLLFSRYGYRVTAADASYSGLGTLRISAREQGLDITTTMADVSALPFGDECFHAILAYHSIYHVDSEGMKKAIDEVNRVLRPGGELYLSLISKTADSYYNARCNAIDANVRLKKEEDGSVLPHYYVDYADIQHIMADFAIVRIRHVEDFYDGQSGWHYFVHAAKPDRARTLHP